VIGGWCLDASAFAKATADMRRRMLVRWSVVSRFWMLDAGFL
jgi:hypothetical protein